MKAIIDLKLYDTDTAELIYTCDTKDGFSVVVCTEYLYKTENGNYFSYLTQECVGSPTEIIEELTMEKTIEWLTNHDGTDRAIELFKDEIEEA